MSAIQERIMELFNTYLPNLFGALAILIFGWLVAFALSSFIRNILRKITLNKKVAKWIGAEEDKSKAIVIEEWISQGIYYLLLLFVLVAFFQTLNLTIITEPINRLLTQILEFMPRLIGAVILLLIAWILASVLRLIVSQVLKASKLDEKLSVQAGLEYKEQLPLAKTLGDAVYWLVLLLFLPAILDALALEKFLQPVQTMIDKVLGFLPNLFAAGLILLVGWFIARIVQRIVTNLLAAVGADRLSEQIGLAPVLGEQKLSGLLGLIVYVLILIPVLISALNSLSLEAITQPASNMLNTILEAIPAIFAAALVIAIAYVVGKVVTRLLTNLLTGAGFNKILIRLGLGKELKEGEKTPSEIVGYLAMVAIMLFAITEAFRLLNFTAMSDLLSQFMVFAGHVILGLIIFGVGLYLANLASKTIKSSNASQANLLALVARVSILVLAGAMALRQMGLANEIINLAFGFLFGAIAVAVAIAFGLGGRDIAAREVEKWIESVKSKES